MISPNQLAAELKQRFGFATALAVEIECYLNAEPPSSFAGDFLRACADAGAPVLKWEAERGHLQYEFAMPVEYDVDAAIAHADAAKRILHEMVQADFRARPFADRPGSGLHVHLHLEDAQGRNVFFKRDEEISDSLKWALGGLMATMREHMAVFAPTPESRTRFTPGGNAPTTVSWGANNRTAALRLPDEGAPRRHIEHRVAGADADVGAVVAAILQGVLAGLEGKLEPGPQVYGDASLESYGLVKLF